MKKILCSFLFVILFIGISFADDTIQVYTEGDNIYIETTKVGKRQLTFQNKDHNPALSPDGRKIVFIRDIKPCPYNSDTGWFPGDHDEIWSMNTDGSGQRCVVKNNYSEHIDMKNYLGSFGNVYISADGEKIYFLCQNCTTDAILYTADIDGSNIRRVCNAHQLDLVGGDPSNEYYGYLVIGQRQSSIEKIKWASVLLDTNGTVAKEIEDIEQFWQEHEKL